MTPAERREQIEELVSRLDDRLEKLLDQLNEQERGRVQLGLAIEDTEAAIERVKGKMGELDVEYQQLAVDSQHGARFVVAPDGSCEDRQRRAL